MGFVSMTDPAIPFGYRRVFGQAQRGDGIYDHERGEFAKVRKAWPTTDQKSVILIRRCEAVQTEIAGAEAVETMEVE